MKVLLVGSGPSYDYPGDEDLVQLKECTRDVREPTSPALVFSAKKIDVQVLVSVFFFFFFFFFFCNFQ